MGAQRAAAVIAHYGDPARTIRAVRRHIALGRFSRIVVVANDGIRRPEGLQEAECEWLVPARNLGFGGACQFGAEGYLTEAYGFFNGHVTIDRSSLDLCLAALEEPDVGIVAPYIYHKGVRGVTADWRYTYCRRTYSRILGLPIQDPLPRVAGAGRSSEVRDNEWATGGALFCRREVVHQIGWNSFYFLGYEDVDLSIRAKRSGWRIVTACGAIAHHTGESTRAPSVSSYYAMRNALWFARQYRSRPVQVALSAYLTWSVSRILLADVVKRRHPAHSWPSACGIIDGWRVRPGNDEMLLCEPVWPRARGPRRRTRP